jgi:hypothetical protein
MKTSPIIGRWRSNLCATAVQQRLLVWSKTTVIVVVPQEDNPNNNNNNNNTSLSMVVDYVSQQDTMEDFPSYIPLPD